MRKYIKKVQNKAKDAVASYKGRRELTQDQKWRKQKAKECAAQKLGSGMIYTVTKVQGKQTSVSHGRDIRLTPPKYLSPGSTARKRYFHDHPIV